MKIVILTQNKYTVVDDEDYEKLSKYKWQCRESSGNYYAQRTTSKDGKRLTFQMAREIMGLTFGDKREVDHINHNSLNNRKYNLRVCSHSENQHNRKNSRGCWYDKRRNKWSSEIRINKKKIWLGYFDSEKDAHEKYLKAKVKYCT